MEGIWDSERMRECTVWFSSVERMRVMCRATWEGGGGVLVDVCMYVVDLVGEWEERSFFFFLLQILFFFTYFA